MSVCPRRRRHRAALAELARTAALITTVTGMPVRIEPQRGRTVAVITVSGRVPHLDVESARCFLHGLYAGLDTATIVGAALLTDIDPTP